MFRHSKNNLIKHHVGVLLIITVYYTVINFFGITCPIKVLTGKVCPTCGMTRAMLSLLRFDFKGYVHYNPMALFTGIAVQLIIHRKKIKPKLLSDMYCILALTANTVYHIITILSA